MAITTFTFGTTSSTATPSISLGFTAAAGDLVIVLAGQDGSSSCTWPGSWQELKDADFTAAHANVAYLIAAGGETSVQPTSSLAERWEAVIIRIPAGEWHGTTPPEISTGATGSSTGPNPDSLSPSWGAVANTVAIAACFRDDSVANTVTGWPTGYDDNQTDQNATTSACNVACAIDLVNTSSIDPGAFTLSASETWAAYTIAVRPAAGGGGGTTVTPSTASLTLTTFAPTVTVGGPFSHVAYYNGADVGATPDPTIGVAASWEPGDLILVYITGKDDGFVIAGVTDDGPGEAYAEVEWIPDTQGQVRSALWAATAEGTGSSDTITAATTEDNWSAGGGIQIEVIVVPDAAIDASHAVENGGTDTDTPSIDLTTIAATTRRFAWFQHRTRTFTVDGADALTAIRENTQAGSSGGVSSISSYYKDESSAGSKNASGTLSAVSEWTAIAVSVKAAGGGTTVTPATRALSLATFAPTVTATAHQLLTPSPASLTTARFAPVLRLGLTAGPATLTSSSFAPQLRLGVTVPAAALTLATFAPTVTATAHQVLTPSTASLTLTTFAPTVTAAAGLTLVPATAALALTALAPAVSVTAHQAVTPATRALSLATFAPTVTATAHQLLTPSTRALALATFAPVVSASGHQIVTPSTASLVLAAFVPGVTAGAGLTLIPGVRALALATFAPVVTTTAHQLVTPATRALSLAGLVPIVTSSAHRLVTPAPSGLVTTAFNPAVTASDHQRVTAALAVLALVGLAPDVAVVLLPSVFYGDPPVITGASIGPRITGSTSGAPRITEAAVVSPVIVEVQQ
jgi:hypothetical protein